MIDIKLKYQASIFADIKHITPTSDNISILLETFRDREFIPNVIQEIGSSEIGFEPRIMLSNLKGEWGVMFGSNRINIEKSIKDEQGNNLGELEAFCNDASDIFKKIYEKFRIRSNRLALVTTYLLEEMSSATLNATYLNLFNPMQFYVDNSPFEWAARSAAKTPFEFSELKETLNVLATVSRVRIGITLPDKLIPLDRIQVQLDINTAQESNEPRFEVTNTSEFYKKILPFHDSLLREIEGKIYG